MNQGQQNFLVASLKKDARAASPEGSYLAKRPKMDKENCVVVSNNMGANSKLRSPLRSIGHIINGIAVTPPHSRLKILAEPATPTTNFKLLSSVAASLEYLDDSSLTNTECSAVEGIPVLKNTGRPSSRNRKERSLSFICDRFLLSYPPYPDDDEELYISVDIVASNLGVERRRMYDIINVLESINVVAKVGKNSYRYYGKKKLLAALKALSIKARAAYLPTDDDCENNPINLSTDSNLDDKKEKTLGAMSQKFLMMFLRSEQQSPVSLHYAADLLMGDSKYSRDSVPFKTKIRRLYDIANIFVSVRLIEKDAKVGRQSFKYVGPSLTYLQQIDSEKTPRGDKFVLQYLFPSAIQGNDHTETKVKEPEVSCHRNSFIRTRSETWSSDDAKKTCKTFPRHSSFHDICTAAEAARKKLLDVQECPIPTAAAKVSNIRLLLPKPTHALQSRTHSNLVHLKVPSVLVCKSSFPSTVEPRATTALNKTTMQPVCLTYSDRPAVAENNNPVNSKLQKSDDSSSNQRVINLTGEQRNNILKFLNVSLEEGQVASILISNGKDDKDRLASHFKLSTNQPLLIKGVSVNNPPKEQEANELSFQTVASNSFDGNYENKLNNIATDSPTPVVASPISIPSGYTTPSISNICDPTFLPYKEVTEVLSTIGDKFPLLSKAFAGCNTSPNENVMNLSLSKDGSNSSDDSVNQEIQAFTNCHKRIHAADKAYLLDEKTMSSPIKQINSEKSSVADQAFAQNSSITLVKMPLLCNYFQPITVPHFTNISPSKRLDNGTQSLCLSKTADPTTARSKFKQPRIIARKLVMNNQ